jgi:hypothetical protein
MNDQLTPQTMPEVPGCVIVAAPCVRCGKPIGYGRGFYGSGRGLVHADCEEQARQRENVRRAQELQERMQPATK